MYVVKYYYMHMAHFHHRNLHICITNLYIKLNWGYQDKTVL